MLNPTLMEYQRRYLNGEIDPVTCFKCLTDTEELVPMYLRYKGGYYFECFACGSTFRPGIEFINRLKEEMNE